MSVTHSTMSDPNIHEPKGISTASSNQVYKSNGLGSGSWVPLLANSDIFNISYDIHTSGTTYLVLPCTGTITDLYLVSDAATTVATTTITTALAGVSITGGSFSIASGVTAGTVQHTSPSANNVISSIGTVFSLTSNGGTGVSTPSRISIVIQRTT